MQRRAGRAVALADSRLTRAEFVARIALCSKRPPRHVKES